MLSLLKVFNAVELNILKLLKVNCSKIASSASIQIIFINDEKMTADNFEKHCFVVSNISIRLETFYKFLELFYTPLAFERHIQHGLLCSKVFHVLASSA